MKIRVLKSLAGPQRNMFEEEPGNEGLRAKFPIMHQAAQEDYNRGKKKDLSFATKHSFGFRGEVGLKLHNDPNYHTERKAIMNENLGDKPTVYQQMKNLSDFFNKVHSDKPDIEKVYDKDVWSHTKDYVKKSLADSLREIFANAVGTIKNAIDNDKKAPAKVSSIAVVYRPDFETFELLMGKRIDSGKWTLPGGHAEGKENALETAERELKEETGIEADDNQMIYLGEQSLMSEENKPIDVTAFMYATKEKTSTKEDPDNEVKKWEWIDVCQGLPAEIGNNLHAPKNVTLRLLGLQQTDYAMKFKNMMARKYGDDDEAKEKAEKDLNIRIALIMKKNDTPEKLTLGKIK